MAAVVAALVGLAATSSGQPAAVPEFDQITVDFGRNLFRDKADCEYCHGWRGDGRVSNRSGGGANLRETTLDAAALAETIKCGRPTTLMPYHDRSAYRDDRCYGLTAADLGRDMPNIARATLQQREIDAVVAFLLTKVVGTETSFDYCVYYFEEEASACAEYRP